LRSDDRSASVSFRFSSIVLAENGNALRSRAIVAIVTVLVVVIALAIVVANGKSEPFEVAIDLSNRDPAKLYDFNVALLTHLGQPISLDLVVKPQDLNRDDGWLHSTYYITPNELRGIELRVPDSAIKHGDNGTSMSAAGLGCQT